MIKTKIIRVGNSRGVIINKHVLDHLNLDKGDEVQLHITKNDDKVLFFMHITEMKRKNPKIEVRNGDRYLGFITGFEDNLDDNPIEIPSYEVKKVKRRLGV